MLPTTHRLEILFPAHLTWRKRMYVCAAKTKPMLPLKSVNFTLVVVALVAAVRSCRLPVRPNPFPALQVSDGLLLDACKGSLALALSLGYGSWGRVIFFV